VSIEFVYGYRYEGNPDQLGHKLIEYLRHRIGDDYILEGRCLAEEESVQLICLRHRESSEWCVPVIFRASQGTVTARVQLHPVAIQAFNPALDLANLGDDGERRLNYYHRLVDRFCTEEGLQRLPEEMIPSW